LLRGDAIAAGESAVPSGRRQFLVSGGTLLAGFTLGAVLPGRAFAAAPAGATKDPALNRPVAVSSTDYAPTPASFAVDGLAEIGTKGSGWRAAAGDPQWITVDLQAPCRVTSVVRRAPISRAGRPPPRPRSITPGTRLSEGGRRRHRHALVAELHRRPVDPGRPRRRPELRSGHHRVGGRLRGRLFTIQVSDDGTTWSDVKAVDDNPTPLRVVVNGTPVFCRGGSWGWDELLRRMTPERMDAAMALHRDMNFIWLLPGESKDVTVSWTREIAAPAVVASAHNAPSVTV
jgi:hypothetical protein